jgi:flavin-dependent dehydrogenase
MRIGSDGCLGLAPVGDGLFNATLVVEAKRAREISGDVEAFFRRGLEAYGLTESLTAAPLELPVEVTGPFEVRPRRRVGPGALLVGDAAGYFDPFTGQGVYRALAAARLAARHVDRLLGARTESERVAIRRSYGDALERSFAPARRLQRLVDHVVSRPSLIDRVGRLLARRPGLARLLLRITGDLDRASALVRPDRLLDAWNAPGSTADTSIADTSIASPTPRRESLAHA